MALNKLRRLDQNSLGITLPKDDLRIEGLLDEHGDLEGEHHLHIRYIGDGEWTVELVDAIDT
ncbi:hypothetical protein [Natrinema versiforme]|uniref:DUF8053 domain-containing protein n=1 Tax=Natrinema versiforme JCM 10478 TaxID=1227496 RepID=L9XSD1_9EURY|nr:hypothetical protein [Natrinema versiforme]ELY64709.1 hypothetical protein C489_16630 [Natrinema versiforme JCM 10478]